MSYLPDDLALKVLAAMVNTYRDDEADGEENLEEALAAAIDECYDDLPDGVIPNKITEDLAGRGWLRIHRGVEYETGNEEPLEGAIEIDEITGAGFSAANAATEGAEGGI